MASTSTLNSFSACPLEHNLIGQRCSTHKWVSLPAMRAWIELLHSYCAQLQDMSTILVVQQVLHCNLSAVFQDAAVDGSVSAFSDHILVGKVVGGHLKLPESEPQPPPQAGHLRRDGGSLVRGTVTERRAASLTFATLRGGDTSFLDNDWALIFLLLDGSRRCNNAGGLRRIDANFLDFFGCNGDGGGGPPGGGILAHEAEAEREKEEEEEPGTGADADYNPEAEPKDVCARRELVIRHA